MHESKQAEAVRGSGTKEEHAKLLLGSYACFTGKTLVEPRPGQSLAEAVHEARIVVLSHGTEADPILNYGNRMAMRLWEMDEATFTTTPSRLTAEPMEREARARFMARVSARGYVDDYTGIRVSTTGRRFAIVDATVWNLVDEYGTYKGQAATFAEYRYV
ncbi:MEKHLA domain-containing protein [Paenibacillus soyae]|uniref:MEKHLA domain-containing protein n=1 Tax=Paenibacillus soyae TaxID=2969249 RepID=A0A9X2MRT4_9BACL|nr:MEKHLA domain-containing protein [Paenibacillus soyae]MCR2804586.1 MEKHLA domain-containing protein [Paenibacillus soyae]